MSAVDSQFHPLSTVKKSFQGFNSVASRIMRVDYQSYGSDKASYTSADPCMNVSVQSNNGFLDFSGSYLRFRYGVDATTNAPYPVSGTDFFKYIKVLSAESGTVFEDFQFANRFLRATQDLTLGTEDKTNQFWHSGIVATTALAATNTDTAVNGGYYLHIPLSLLSPMCASLQQYLHLASIGGVKFELGLDSDVNALVCPTAQKVYTIDNVSIVARVVSFEDKFLSGYLDSVAKNGGVSIPYMSIKNNVQVVPVNSTSIQYPLPMICGSANALFCVPILDAIVASATDSFQKDANTLTEISLQSGVVSFPTTGTFKNATKNPQCYVELLRAFNKLGIAGSAGTSTNILYQTTRHMIGLDLQRDVEVELSGLNLKKDPLTINLTYSGAGVGKNYWYVLVSKMLTISANGINVVE
jgi:hypothetical protein